MSILTISQSVPSVVVPRDGLSIAVDIAVILLAVVGVIFLLFGLVQLRRLGSILLSVRNEAGRRAEPIFDRSRSIAKNVEYISATVRADVESVNGSVRALSDRLQQAADRMEERIEEFNALMEVVQGEAESAFLGTASTVRGLRAGARSLAGAEDEDARDRPESGRSVASGSTDSERPGGEPDPSTSERSA